MWGRSQVETQNLVFEVVGVLIAVSAFLTGFRSVNIHGHRDRMFERLDRLYERVAMDKSSVADTAGTVRNAELAELQSAARDVFRPYRIVMPALANLALLAGVLVIVLAYMGTSGWPAGPDVWLLGSLVGAEVLVVVVMFTDSRRVGSQFAEKWRWLTLRLPWLPIRLAQLEAERIELLLIRLTESVQGGRPNRQVSQRIARLLLLRTKEAVRYLRAMSTVYDTRFILESGELDELGKSVSAMRDLLAWLGSVVGWLRQLLRIGRIGGVISPPPKRPQIT